MIAVDDKGFRVRHRADERRDIRRAIARVVEDLAEEHQVVTALGGGIGETVRKVGEGLDRDGRDLDQTFLRKPLHLPAEAVELAVGGQDPHRPLRRQAGQKAHHELMGVRREGDRLRVGKRQRAAPCRCAPPANQQR